MVAFALHVVCASESRAGQTAPNSPSPARSASEPKARAENHHKKQQGRAHRAVDHRPGWKYPGSELGVPLCPIACAVQFALPESVVVALPAHGSGGPVVPL